MFQVRDFSMESAKLFQRRRHAGQEPMRWQDMPERYGKYKTTHKRFTRWTAKKTATPVAKKATAAKKMTKADVVFPLLGRVNTIEEPPGRAASAAGCVLLPRHDGRGRGPL